MSGAGRVAEDLLSRIREKLGEEGSRRQEETCGGACMSARTGWVMGNCTKSSVKDRIKKVRSSSVTLSDCNLVMTDAFPLAISVLTLIMNHLSNFET